MKTRTFSCKLKAIGMMLLSFCCCFNNTCLAAIPKTNPRTVADDYYELDLSKIQKIESERDLRSDDVAQVIPLHMQATEDVAEVGRQIANHALRNWMKSPAMRKTSVGRASQKMENNLQTNVSLGQSGENKTEHKIKFQIEPTQTQAAVKYSGLVDANLSYRAANDEWKFEISQKINDSAEVVINRTANNNERVDNVSVRWTF